MTPEQLMQRKVRIRKLNAALKKLFPNAGIELTYKTPLQLLIAVQLSAQCTDKMVNTITAQLFKKYKKLDDYVNAGKSARGIREFERMIRSSGFYHAKAKNILAATRMIEEKFGGKVPRTMRELLMVPGVARKTATVVLSEAFGIVDGITVDTHVIRFVHRYDLSDYLDAVRIEKDLMQLLPKKERALFTHRVIHYGRYMAPARKHDTSNDPLVRIYPPAGKQFRVQR